MNSSVRIESRHWSHSLLINYSPHDILRVSCVMTLRVLLTVKQNGNGCHIVQQLTGGQHPQVSAGVNASVPVPAKKSQMLMHRSFYSRGVAISGPIRMIYHISID